MKLSAKVFSTLLGITAIFLILIVALLFQYTASVSITSNYVQEAQPARAAIQHLQDSIYQDFLLVEEYLLVQDYTNLNQYENLLAHSQEQCEILTEEVDDLIALEKLNNVQVIQNYKTAVLVYSSWERSRDTLLQLHKDGLATNNIDTNAINQEKDKFVTLMQSSTTLFTQSLDQLDKEHVLLQQELTQKTKTVKILLALLLILFLIVSISGIYFLTFRVAKPLDQMSKTSVQFSKGNYKQRIKESSSIVEILSLQKQLNKVYSLIDKTFTTKEQKNTANQHLLPSQYKDILEFIQNTAQKGRTPTIKDVKKEFKLTHPTVVSRLKYLQENGYIYLRKQGRSKCIFETS